jgi:hypothetical protein
VSKINLKNGKKLEEVGQAIMDAWDNAITASPSNPSIDRDALLTALTNILDLQDPADTDRTVELDLVFDTDLSATKRLVWLSIPTPDREKAGMDDTWKKYKKRFFDDLSKAEKREKRRQIAQAVLFGCGR